MKIILKEEIYQEEIKHSKFITLLFLVKSKEEIKTYLEKVKREYPKANHYCYAFRLEQEKGMSDDREPAKTAGAPMLTVLEKQDMVQILAVTVRYFGGIKLGPGGLIKAYTSGVQHALELASKQEVEPGYEVTISCSYQEEKKLERMFQTLRKKNKYYDEKCHLVYYVTKKELELMQEVALEYCTPTLIPKGKDI